MIHPSVRDPAKGLRLIRVLSNIDCFDWDDTPEGYAYWKKVNANLCGLIGQGQAILSESSDNYAEEMWVGFSTASFIWSETPQGSDYWAEVHRNAQANVAHHHRNNHRKTDGSSFTPMEFIL